MRAFLLSVVVGCSSPTVHDEVPCASAWGTGRTCELACEQRPYNQDGEPDGSTPETCSARHPKDRPGRICNVFYTGDSIDGSDHRGCCVPLNDTVRFYECCAENTCD